MTKSDILIMEDRNMSKNIALKVSGIVFAIVAVMHLLRIIFNSEIIISGYVVSMQFSIVGAIVALCLSIWMFMASKHE